MSRLSIDTKNRSQETVEELYRDAERRIQASQPGLCPVDLARSFLHICHSQSCGKCTPCRVGLGQLEDLMEQVLDGEAELDTLDLIARTAESIFVSADCAIGQEAARMVLKGSAATDAEWLIEALKVVRKLVKRVEELEEAKKEQEKDAE